MQSKPKTVAHILAFSWRFNRYYVLFCGGIILLLAFQSNINIILSKYVVNSIGDKNSFKAILVLGAACLIQIIFLIIQQYKSYLDIKVNERFDLYNQKRLFDLLVSLPLIEKEHPDFSRKYEIWKNYSGKYLESFNQMCQFAQLLLTCIISIFYLTSSYWFLGLIALIIAGVSGLIDIKTIPRRLEFNQEINNSTHRLQYFYGTLSASEMQKELTMLNAFDFIFDKWLVIKNKIFTLKISMERLNTKISFANEFISIFMLFVISAVSIYLIFQNKLTMGDYISIPLMFALVENSAKRVIINVSRLAENKKYIEIFRSDIQEMQTASEPLKSFNFSEKIIIENLSFSYPNQLGLALHNINLEIEKGEKVVILGNNAAGKSTLIKLLLGLYKAPQKTISYDRVYQEELNMEELWGKTGVTFQDFGRFMLTVEENVVIGDINKKKDENQVQALLGLVGLDTAKFRKGLHSEIGYLSESSINLSGGQWQRLALARCLYKDTDLLIFDEPTSALDPLSELDFFQMLMSMSGEKTLIIISHRISIASKADKIVMMDAGHIKEIGTHDQLLQLEGDYYEMWEKQKKWYQPS